MAATEEGIGGILDVPAIEPFQFDAVGVGTLQKTVNLFRGDVNFKVPLVTLAGRGGLDVQVAGLYRSDVEYSASHWNREAPTSVLGLGWDVPVDRIVARGDGSAMRAGNAYYLVRDGSSNRLFRTARTWLRGTLEPALASKLTDGPLAPELVAALLDQGLLVDASALVVTLAPGESWRIVDAVNERTLALSSGADALLVADGGQAYEAESFDFSRIRYYPEFERWEITYANAITAVFGGGAGDSVEWGVRWGNWVGASALTHDPRAPSTRAQRQYATAWNMSGSYTVWGDTVAFEYEQVQQPVGADGLPYTKACYLGRIVDVFGRTITFEYAEKKFVSDDPAGAREYFDPNKRQPNDTPDAFQSRYQTRFLSGVSVAAESGAPLYSLTFGYELRSYATLSAEDQPSLVGDTTKRTLTSILKTVPGGEAQPPLTFTYYGASDSHPGALRGMSYPEGATATYIYEQTELSSCSRALKIASPYVGGTPRVWFGPDYAVLVWYDGQGKLVLSAYTWIGRWQEWQPAEPVIEQPIDMSDIEVELQEDFFVLHYAAAGGGGAACWAFHKDERVLGSWIANAANPILLQSADREVTSGSEFFAIADRYLQSVTAYAWNGLAASWTSQPLAGICDPGASGEKRLYVTGAGRVLLVLCYDVESAPGSKRSRLTLQYLDELGQWQLGDRVGAPEIAIAGSKRAGFAWMASPWAAAASFVTDEEDTSLRYSVALYTWGADGEGAYKLGPPTIAEYGLEKTPTGRVTIPFAAAISETGLVLSGPHLLRYNGAGWLRNDNLDVIEPATDETVFWFALGSDCVLKSESSPTRVLAAAQAFDPNTQSSAWSAAAIALYDDPPVQQRLARYFPTAASDFVSWDLDVYARGTSTDWIAPLESEPFYRLDPTVDTTTIVDEGPSFLAYLVQEGEGKTKTVLGTQLLVISNGQCKRTEQLPERFFQVVGEDGSLRSDVAGMQPGGPRSFLTYLPLTADFDAAESVTLHRFLDESVQVPIEDFPVAAVEFDDGFQTVVHSFEFSGPTAACDSSGQVAKYYRTAVWVGGGERPNGWTEYTFVNGLSAAGETGPRRPSVLDGLPAKKTIFDRDGHEVASVSTSWVVETSIVDLATGQPAPIRGAYVEAAASTRAEDGLALTTRYEYDRACGYPTRETASAYNARGQLETRTASTTYGFAVYPALAHANELSAAVQQTARVEVASGEPIVSSSSATTWEAFERPQGSGALAVWAPRGSWTWLGGEGSSDFPFASAHEHGAPGWFESSRIGARSAHGVELETEAPPGTVTSKLYDTLESVTVASFSHARLSTGEAYYYGFEDYESAGAWALDTARTPIVQSTFNCGSRSLSLPAGASTSELQLTPSGGGRFLLSFWARTDGQFASAGEAGWKIAIGGAPASSLAIEATPTWTYYTQLVDLSSLSGVVTVQLSAYNGSAGASVYIDNVAFASYEGQLVATVYDEPRFLRIAEVGPYNNLTRTVYDPLGRLVAKTDAGQGVIQALAPYLARQDNLAPSPAQPNCQTCLQPMGEALYERFADGEEWLSRWRSQTPAQWSAVPGRLEHAAGAAGSIELAAPALSGDCFLHTRVAVAEPPQAGLGVALGTLEITWDPSSERWTLKDSASGAEVVAALATPDPGGSWLFALSGQAVLFLLDGRPLLSWTTAPPPTGAIRLLAGSRVSFGELVLGGSPQIAIKFFDGASRSRQGHSIESASTTVTATVYDAVGRAAVQTKPARFAATDEQPLLAYRQGFVTSLDWDSGLMSGELAQALPQDGGYPYSRQRFESSPLSRVIETGQAGKDFAITAAAPAERHTARVAFAANAAAGFPVDMGLPAGEYKLTTRVDPDGVAALTVSDKWGGRVAEGLLLDAAAGRYLTSSYLRDYLPAGQLETVRLPNFHNPPQPEQRDAWVRTTTRDMRGRIVARTAASGGTAVCVYDARGNLRFSQDAAGAAAGTIVYRKYDPFARPIEQGTLALAWSRPQLEERAEQPDWPGAAEGTVPARSYRYDGDGVDVLQMGLLTETACANPGAAEAVAVAFRYDERTRVSSTTTSLPAVASTETYETRYTYDNLGNALSARYPSGTEVIAHRDSAGRVQAITDERGATLARYEYDPGDRVLLETAWPGTAAEVATAYAYTSPGWLQAIESPLLKQQLQYTAGGFGGAGYFSGKIARQDISLTLSDPGEFPANLAYQYAYDASGRLLTASALAGGQARPDLSLGLPQPISYDDNGNFLAVPAGQETDVYRYPPGSDFALGKSGATSAEYAPDPNGAATSALPHGVTDITYDSFSHLPVTIATQGNGLIAIEYGTDGRRVAKRTEQGTLIYSRGAGGASLMEELKPAGGQPVRTEYLYGPTGLLAVREQGRTLTVLHDHLRSPRALVDEAGAVVAANQYLPFGSFAATSYGEADALRYGFAGYELDRETGLYNAVARLYDAELRRFLATDPRLQFASPYVYGANDPVSMVDPDGRSAWWAMLLGAVVGAAVTILTGGAAGAAGVAIFGVGMSAATAADIAASAVVGAVAGAAGSISGDAVTAAASHESYTGQRALVDALTGIVGGAVGAGVGGIAASGAISAAADYGLTAAKWAGTAAAVLAGGASGALASAGVASALTGQPFMGGGSAATIAVGAVAGIGAGLLASGTFWTWMGTMPRPIGPSEFGQILADDNETLSETSDHRMLTFVSDDSFNDTEKKVVNAYGSKEAIFDFQGTENGRGDVIALHGVGRFVMPMTRAGYARPMPAALFAQYLQQRWSGWVAPARWVTPIKLVICFGAQPFGGSSSVGAEIANALGRTTVAGRGVIYPWESASPMSWVRF